MSSKIKKSAHSVESRQMAVAKLRIELVDADAKTGKLTLKQSLMMK